jgi:hypothetical protein
MAKRKITRTAYDAQYRRALAQQQSRPDEVCAGYVSAR